MFHNFRYTLKILFSNKILLFWTFAFPLILGTLFQMAFQDIEKKEQLDTIPIAIISNEKWAEAQILQEVFEAIGEEEKPLFEISYVTEHEAKTLLEDNKISGYLILSDSLKVVIKENGINQTVLKFVTEEILETEEIIKNMMMLEHSSATILDETFYQELYAKVMQLARANKTELVDLSSTKMSYTMIEFYTLIAMTCLYGGTLGLYVITQNLPNQSANGKRIAVSPTAKIKTIVSGALAGYTVQLIGLTLLFLYTIFVLHIDYGDNIGLIILLSLVGSLAGLSLGIMIASVFRANENTKTGIVISLTMLGCFLSGMMGITMKYIVDQNMKIVNLINPASMITDGFYALYYYETLDRYFFNIICLLLFSGVMLILSIRSLRRQKYDSI